MHKFSSSQVNLPVILQAIASQCGLCVPERDLAMDGREKQPHVTIRHGLMDMNIDAIRATIASIPSFEIKFGNLGMFPSHGDGDVLFVSVSDSVGAGGLFALRRRLDAYAAKDAPTHAKYKPHMTVAYLKPGVGDHFAGMACMLTDKTMWVDSIIYSERNGTMHECPLKVIDREQLVKPADIHKFYRQIV